MTSSGGSLNAVLMQSLRGWDRMFYGYQHITEAVAPADKTVPLAG